MAVGTSPFAAIQDVDAATLHEAAGGLGALPSDIAPAFSGVRAVGAAFPVVCAPGDNLWIHRALLQASAGDVLVVSVGDDPEHGYWGEVLSEAGLACGLAGVVIAGGVRDTVALARVGLPVFAARTCIRGTSKDPERAGGCPTAVTIGEVTVRRGDLVVGDADGVVVLAAATAQDVVAQAAARIRDEERIIERVRAGESTLEIYGLPR